MTKITTGIFANKRDAEVVINALRAAGVSNDEISYVARKPDGEVEASTTGGQVADGVAGGAVSGAVLGAIAGLVVANGILPGLGTLFVAGPLATALGFTGAAATAVAGTVTGAAAGGLLGALMGLGIAEDDAKFYEERIKVGDTLLTTTSDKSDIKEIFARHNAKEIREYTS